MGEFERGSRIGAYTLVARHWDGALGDVWVARRTADARRPKLYALRMLRDLDADATSRLVGWGCAMGHVDEPSIARAIDVVTDGVATAVVSELVAGESLHQVCRVVRGWSPALALSSVLVLARTIQRVQELKNSNGTPVRLDCGTLDADHVVVDYERHRLVMLDFGLGAALDDQPHAFAHADVLGLGRLLWEMLAGRVAPEASGPRAPKLPSMRSLGVKSTKAMDKLLRTATAPDPALRYGSVSAFIADLEKVLDEHKRLDVPEEIGRILRQRLQHRVQATRTLVQRWSVGPQAASKPNKRAPAPAPRMPAPRTNDVIDLPMLEPVEMPAPPPDVGGVHALPLVEPLPLSFGLPPEAAQTNEMRPMRTRDVDAPTADLPQPRASVLRAFRQVTLLGVLVVVALAAGAYASTEAGRAAVDLLFALVTG